MSGPEGWLAAPGAPALVPPARWKTALVSAAGILPLLQLVSYLFSPRLAALLVWARPLISVVIVIPLMQYVVMPLRRLRVRGQVELPLTEGGVGGNRSLRIIDWTGP